MSACARGSLLLLTAAAAACDSAASAPRARMWTLFDVAKLDANAILADQGTFADGFPRGAFLQDAMQDLAVKPGFAEGEAASYITTELWENFPAVWVQPMYVLVESWDPRNPEAQRPKGGEGAYEATFSVGPQSAFYSPFWRVFYAVLPPGKSKDDYRSARRIFADALELHAGPEKFCPLLPEGTAGGPYAVRDGWLDGRPIKFIDLGKDRFTWNQRLEVADLPAFIFTSRGDDGRLRRAGVPTVFGTRPIYGGASPGGGAVAADAYWRLYAVRLPPTAAVYLPAGHQDRAKVTIPVVPAEGFMATDEQNQRFARRVVLDGGCFDRPEPFKTCIWLDSQAAIKQLPPSAIWPSEITLTCPFVSFAGQGIFP